jgi:integrase
MAPKHERRARGTGTIQRQPDGSWIARTSDKSRSGRFPHGSAGYREAEEALETWNRSVRAGRDPKDSRQRTRDFLSDWLTTVCKPPKVQPSTAAFYKRHCEYATTHIGDIALEVLDARAIEMMQGKLADDGLSARSINHVKAVLRNALNVAKRWGLITTNPAETIPDWPVDAVSGTVLTPAQVAILLHAVEGMRHEALYHVALMLGPRRGELLALRCEDIHDDVLSIEQTIKEGEGRATVIGIVKSKEARDLPLTPDLQERLARRVKEVATEARIAQQRAAEQATRDGKPIPIIHWNPLGLLFCSEAGTPIQLSNFNRSFGYLITRINKQLRREHAPDALLLPADLTPHDLRRTALTDLAAHGEAKAVQNIAGHADIDTTMRLYARRRMTAMRAAVDAMEESRRTGT